jgi:hypothetical protein
MSNENEEMWKPVAGYEGLYSVSNRGRVRRDKYKGIRKPTILKPRNSNHGYKQVALFRNSQRKEKYVHTLVATAFIDRPTEATEVNHKNGVKADNDVKNIEWSNRKHNIRHAFATGLRKTKLNNEQVIFIRGLATATKRPTNDSIGAMFGVSGSLIGSVINRKRYVNVPDSIQ